MSKKEVEVKECSKWLTVTLPSGEKKQLRFRGKTEEEANAKREAARAEYNAGLMTFGGDTPFQEYGERYYEIYVAPRYDTKNADIMWGILCNHIFPELGACPIKNITRSVLQKAINKMSGKSKSLIDKAFSLTRGIFVMAYADGAIHRDPAIKLTKPKNSSKGRRALSEEEEAAFMSVFENSDHQFRIAFALCLGCGLRPGEVRALSLPMINTKTWKIQIKNAVKMDERIGGPKTETGVREGIVPEWLRPALLEFTTQKKNSGDPCLLLWHSANNKQISRQRLARGWESYLRMMDIAAGAEVYRNQVIKHSDIGWDELTPYYLRHSFATSLMESGVDLKTAMALMGHETPDMLLKIYSDVNPNMRNSAHEKLTALEDAKAAKRLQKQQMTDTDKETSTAKAQ